MRSWNIDLRAFVKRFVGDRKGAVAVMTGLTLTSLLGFAGLGTDATLWYVAKRNMQGAVDVAAYSAATAEVAGANSTSFTAAAKAVAKQYGFADGVGGVSVTVNNPPLSGSYTTNGEAVEVIISQPQSLLFASLFLSTPPTATSRAVATAGATSDGCVMALDKGNVMDGVGDSGSGTLNLNGCTLYVNSSSSSALQLSGGASINALSAFIVGNYTMSGSSTFKATDGITTGSSAAPNPYAGVKVPTFSGCSSGSQSFSSGSHSLSAATYGGTMIICGNLGTSGTSTSLTLGPGTYIVDSGSFSASGTSTITGTGGVTIILTSSVGSYGTASISGGTSVSLTAPNSGSLSGLAIFQDPRASGKTNTLSGGSSQVIKGALYFPNEAVSYSGGASSGGSTCTQLIGLTLTFSGSSTFNSTCSGAGVAGVGGSTSKLVE